MCADQELSCCTVYPLYWVGCWWRIGSLTAVVLTITKRCAGTVTSSFPSTHPSSPGIAAMQLLLALGDDFLWTANISKKWTSHSGPRVPSELNDATSAGAVSGQPALPAAANLEIKSVRTSEDEVPGEGGQAQTSSPQGQTLPARPGLPLVPSLPLALSVVTPATKNPLPGWVPTHADLAVKKRNTAGASGTTDPMRAAGLGLVLPTNGEHTYRPNALSGGPADYTVRAAALGRDVDFSARSVIVGNNGEGGTRGGVRFHLPDLRVPSSHNGVLAARRRLTMRQSLAQRLRPTESADATNAVGRYPSSINPNMDALAPASSTQGHQAGAIGPFPGPFKEDAQQTGGETAAPRISQTRSETHSNQLGMSRAWFKQQGAGGLDPENQRASCTSATHSSAAGDAHHTPNVEVSGSGAVGSMPDALSQFSQRLVPWRRRLLQVMNHIYFYWLLVFLTFFIIFEDDFKKACLPPTVDLPLEIIITIIVVLFSLEMALSSLLRPGYFLGFYFWLDAIGTSSLVFEVPTVRIKFFGGSQYINLADGGSFFSNAGNQLYISSKAGRVARIFRLMRMLRLYSMYQQYVRRRRIRQALQAAGAAEVANNEEQLSIIEFEMQQEMDRKTKVGQKLEELTTRRIIVGLLIIILLLPAFDIRLGTFGRSKTVGEGALRILHDMAIEQGQNTPSFDTALRVFKEQLVFGTGSRSTGFLFSLKIANVTHMVKSQARRRFEELYYMSFTTVLCSSNLSGAAGNGTITSNDTTTSATSQWTPAGNGAAGRCDRLDTFAVYDWRWYSQVSAMLNIARSLFIIALLVMGAFFLNRDSRNLVLMPIERMLQRVQEMAENPLAMAESRLQLQAPWQDKLAETNTRIAGPGSSNRDSLITSFGLGRNSSSRNSDSSTPPLPPLLPPLLLTGGNTDGGAVGVSPAGSDTATAAAAAAAIASGSGSGNASAFTAGGSPGATDRKATIYRSGGGEHGASRLARLSLATAADGPGSLVAVAGTLHRQSLRFNAMEAAQAVSPFRRLRPINGGWEANLRARWSRFRDRLQALVQKMWDYLWEGPGGQDEENAAAAATTTTGNPVLGAGAYETEVLENSIAKIGALLAIGFGDAGAEVIAENIRNDGDINPMVPGRKTVAVFGFCDIRRFTDTTEVLQEEVMEFVNSIAHIVHTSVSTHGGAPNKNIGDAFLLVWKFPRAVQLRDLSTLSRREHIANASQGSESKRGMERSALHTPLGTGSIGGGGGLGGIVGGAANGGGGASGSGSGSSAAVAGASGTHPGSAGGLVAGSGGGASAGAAAITGPAAAAIAASAAASASASPGSSMIPSVAPKPSLSALALSSAGRVSIKRKFFSLGSNRVAPVNTGGDGSLSSNNHHMSYVAMNSLPRVNTLAQFADDSFPLTGSDGPHVGSANKLTYIKALMSLKHDVDLSWETKKEVITAIADNALASFVLIQLALRRYRSARLKKYAMRKDLNRRMPGFQIAMGFGLHVGWAIEGAIGSEYKIDASYLSPNVNMASRLEAATKQFGVPLLLSEDFVDCLSNEVRSKVRQIDCVTVKGSTQPMGLYTYDIDLEAVPEPSKEEVEEGDDSPVEELMWRSYICNNEWQENPDLVDSWGVDPDFKEDFDRGFHAYRTGNWPEAQRWLELTRTALRDDLGQTRVDGPSDVLLRFMAEHNFTAPASWKGYRELTEK
ncbi:hypothetical protein VOLCADRAFT_89530 [Volvox carteri f. nagariensis]|uniref:Guanylate cyclase domain-containing protein n=1 Tax=Volvox carteri f. nagariensis TaxID=3068 RepID=D8TS31_VOLCA|nr:uncharacterized protein VOLCADRAFT_89530 [Volvox carteri f. nagariensis]EFJ49622.1 hypothetical protein VOLCADRAFT_89530 [Volvox carteri f. nagariensis]|eukprot:XP_002949129.1 hypothetical protein VOLCADRAFT_89530 [Volvox carteri f. nagariensis]